MANISKVKGRMLDVTLSRFGEEVFINGISVKAIFADELFEEEQGTFRKTTLSIKKEDLQFFKEGDGIVVRNRNFVITYIPDIHEPLIDLELKDA
tara:strand:- start:92 stop:376 length:285 start_codon:yes stop_codon:yes gene_type:complete